MNDVDAKSLGMRIKIIRTSKGIGQAELARKIGQSYTTISRYEKGHRSPSAFTLKKIAEVLECSPASLLVDNPNSLPPFQSSSYVLELHSLISDLSSINQNLLTIESRLMSFFKNIKKDSRE